MGKIRKRVFAAVLAATLLFTMPGTVSYAEAEAVQMEDISEDTTVQEEADGTERAEDGVIEETGAETEVVQEAETKDGYTDKLETGDDDTGNMETDDQKPAEEETVLTQKEDADLADCEEEKTENSSEVKTEDTEQGDTGAEDVGTNLCAHHKEHTQDCGYSKTSEDGEGSPCTYECRICPIEDLIAALPRTVTENNEEEVRVRLDKILALYRELTADEQEQIDISRCLSLQTALDGANAPESTDNADDFPAVSRLYVLGNEVIAGSVTSGEGWSYDKTTNTLTLDGLAVTADNYPEGVTKFLDLGSNANGRQLLNVYLKGTNTINSVSEDEFLFSRSYLVMRITGEGGASLTLDGMVQSDFDLISGNITLTLNTTGPIFPDYGMSIDNGATVVFNCRYGEKWKAAYYSVLSQTEGGISVKNGSTLEINATNPSHQVSIMGYGPLTVEDSTLTLKNVYASGVAVYLVNPWSGTVGENDTITIKNSTVNLDTVEGLRGYSIEIADSAINTAEKTALALRGMGGEVTVTDTTLNGLILNNGAPKEYTVSGHANRPTNLTLAEEYTLTVPEGASLNIPEGVTLTNNGTMRIHEKASLTGEGTVTGDGEFLIDEVTADLISVPEGLVYTGVDYTDQIKLTDKVTVCGAEFTADTGGWTMSIDPAVVKGAGEYTVTLSKSGNTSITKTFTVAACGHAGLVYQPLDDSRHGGTCAVCGEVVSEEHTIALAAEADGTVITVNDVCEICNYTNTLGTITLTVPADLTYGDGQKIAWKASEELEGMLDIGAQWRNEAGRMPQKGCSDAIPVLNYFDGTPLPAGKYDLGIIVGIRTDPLSLKYAECTIPVIIASARLTESMVTLSPKSSIYSGAEQKPAITVQKGETRLAEGVDYDVIYSTTDFTNAGEVQITVAGKGNYEDKVEKTFTIAKAVPYIADPPTAAGITYGETLSDSSLSGGTVVYGTGAGQAGSGVGSTETVAGAFTWKEPSTKPAVADSNQTEYTVVFTPSDVANYSPVETKATLAVNKAPSAPGMPESAMDVSNSVEKIGSVPLPAGWEWQASDKDTLLAVGVPTEAVAVYTGADQGNYEKETVTVTITRSSCEHVAGEVLYTGEGEKAPTCTEDGLGHRQCIKCGAVMETGVLAPALGHDYKDEVTKEPTVSAEGERTYTCSRCGDTYTEPIPRTTPEGLWVSGLEQSFPYTGSAIKPEGIRVYHGTTLLREKAEYTISYKNNTMAGTAQVIVTGKGSYKGKATAEFTIEAVDLRTDPNLSASVTTVMETGKNLKPTVAVTWNGKKLKEKTDYTLTYESNIKTAFTEGYDVTISGKGNFTGTIVRKFRVVPRGTSLLNSAKVTGLAKSYAYGQDGQSDGQKEQGGNLEGRAVVPKGLENDLAEIIVKIGTATLKKDTDYTVRTESTDAVGTGYVVIEPAQTSAYAGEKRIPVKITGTDLKKCYITGLEKTYPYTGKSVMPEIKVYTGKNGTGTQIPSDAYTVRYSNCINQGKATVTVTGTASKGYSGSVKATYSIGRLDLAAEEGAGTITVTMPADIKYAKGGAKPQPVIIHTDNGTVRTLREGVDYTLKYSNNTAKYDSSTTAGTKKPALKITGIGNYCGIVTREFAIGVQEIGALEITAADKAYNSGKKGSYYYSAPKVYDLDGKQLKSGKDYTVQYTNAATGREIGKKDTVENGTEIRVTVTASENSGYTGTLSITYYVRDAKDVKDISKAKFDKITTQQYTGSGIKPEVRLYTMSGKTKNYLTAEDYEIIGYYNNVKKGTATILIRGTNAYSGVKSISFKITAADNQSIWSGIF